jgi:hypothetical protein
MTGLMLLCRRAVLASPALALIDAACTSIGPIRLDRDQIDYARAISEVGKRQTLFNIVRLRFAEPPVFLTINQLVSSYTVQGSVGPTFEGFPSAPASSFWGAVGSVQYTDRPTFTLNPVTGEQFVAAYLRPFSPAEIIPGIQGGVPVDKLFRLVVQSIGSLHNTHPLGTQRGGSPEFLPLLGILRTLQEGGALRLRLRHEKEATRAFLAFETRDAPQLRKLVQEVYRLLHLDPASQEMEVVYGIPRDVPRNREIPILTRPLLNVLFAVAAEVNVPDEDVREGRTLPTLHEPGAPRPMIIVRSGPSAPADSYAAVRNGGRWYWVEATDFESKVAFSILELLKSVAESPKGLAPPVLTIPTS